MTTVLKIYAALGMLWSVVVIVAIVQLGQEYEIPLYWPGIALHALLAVACWRCLCLRRGAAILLCTYCCWVAYNGYLNHEWDWTVFWGMTAVVLVGITGVSWRELKSGF